MPRARASGDAANHAIMVVRSSGVRVPDTTIWGKGEIVKNFAGDHVFAFAEMPVNPLGVFTVDQVNAQNPNNILVYSGIRLSDSGTVTIGSEPVEVAANDVIVWIYSGKFINYGPRNIVSNEHYHIILNDKTLAEVDQYQEEHNKKLTYQSDQYDTLTQKRRWTTTNIRVSTSGNGGFTEQGILDTVAEWNANYPNNDIFLVETDNLTYLQVETVDGNEGMPVDLYDEWQEITQRLALADYYARRRWYVIQAGLDELAANNGVLVGSASQVTPNLRDGMLD